MILFRSIAHVALTCLSAVSLVQGVGLTDDNYYGITIGSPFELTWSGDGTVSSLARNGLSRIANASTSL